MSSESPKWIALALSLIAITISTLSWWEARRSRAINEEVNRPLLTVSNVRVYGAAESKDDPLVVILTVSIKNVGKSTARVGHARIEPYLSERPTKCNITTDKVWGGKQGDVEIHAGFEQQLSKAFGLTPECNILQELRFEIDMLVPYVEPSTGREYFQELDSSIAFSQKEVKRSLGVPLVPIR